ncbi:DUF4224 domain-containing protein [Pseudomonas nicosulfuronedens]
MVEVLERLCGSVDALSEAMRRSGLELDEGIGLASREILTEKEVANLTGFKARSRQIKWLQERNWQHELSGGGRPIVGREYLRQRLSGGKTKGGPQLHLSTWQPDFSKVK